MTPLTPLFCSTGNRRPIFDILNEIADKDEKGGYKSKLKKEAGPTLSSMPPPPPPLRSAPTPVSHPAVQAPAMPSNLPVKKTEPLRKAEFADNQAAAMAAKVKMRPPQMPHSAVPVPTPSPANEPTKMAPPPARTPVIPTTMANSPAQYQPPIPQPSVSPHSAHPPPAVAAATALNQAQKKGAPLKKEEQQVPTAVALPLPQSTQVIPTVRYWVSCTPLVVQSPCLFIGYAGKLAANAFIPLLIPTTSA